MNPDELFNKAKSLKKIPKNSVLQSTFQFGVLPDKLADLVLKNIKTATTSAYELYEDGDQLPKKGAFDIILDSNDKAICIIQNDDVEIINYVDVSEKHAYAEGEGDRSLSYWRTVHDVFFENEFKNVGKVFNPNTAKVVLETFHVVYVA